MVERPIVKASEAKRYKNDEYGITYEVLSVGPNSMITKMLYETGDEVPEHSHRSEQSGYVISGRYRVVFGEQNQVLQTGDGYTIPGDVPHQIKVVKSGEV